MRIRPKNWESFQHYKRRSPPWVKLHKRILDNVEFQCLPLASRALAPMLWLLASDHPDGEIDADCKNLAWRLRRDESEIADGLMPLIESGFFVADQDASEMLATRMQHATPETETETETDKASRKHRASKALAFSLPAWIPEQPWAGYLEMRVAKRARATDRAKSLVVKELEKLRSEGHDPAAVLEQSTRKGWTDVYPLKNQAASAPAWEGAK